MCSDMFSLNSKQDSKFWKLYKEDPAACAIVIKTSVGVVQLLATLLEPFIPSFSHKVNKVTHSKELRHLDRHSSERNLKVAMACD